MYCKLREATFTTFTYFVPAVYITDVEHVFYSMFLMFLLKYKTCFCVSIPKSMFLQLCPEPIKR